MIALKIKKIRYMADNVITLCVMVLWNRKILLSRGIIRLASPTKIISRSGKKEPPIKDIKNIFFLGRNLFNLNTIYMRSPNCVINKFK